MKLVIDTNVIVSALLNTERVPAITVRRILELRCVVLYDARILEEYRTVLGRPKFASIPCARAEELVNSLISIGHNVGTIHAFSRPLVDATDLAFVEVAIAGEADVLVTGNEKHYPRDLGFAVMGPTALLGLLSAQ
jgi:putative PIN family toxin of toxin-antitoxin system